MFLLYNLLLTLLAPIWVPWMLWRVHRRGEKPNWRERQGDYRETIPKKGDRPRLWVHAVSVGEVVAAQPLLRSLRAELPQHEIVLSVTTSSGHQTARELAEKPFDFLVYTPIDIARFALIAMQRVRPDALIVMETELWFNLFWAAKTFDAKVIVANARLSDRAYPRSKKLAFFYRALFQRVDRVLAQSETDAERFRSLGAENVLVAGNVKFDQALEGLDNTTDWTSELKLDGRSVIVVGSLRAEEFDSFADLIACDRKCQWIVAPRHVERAKEFEGWIRSTVAEAAGCPFEIGYRHSQEVDDLRIIETYGELAKIYRIADLVVIGGSFKKLGGQNIIQPLAHGKPVLHGPHMANFRDVAALGRRAGATLVCENVVDLRAAIERLIEDEDQRRRMGAAAKRLVEDNRGASERMAKIVASTLKA